MIKDILAKYAPFYKGGSGYTSQINVDDFNELVRYIQATKEEKDVVKEVVYIALLFRGLLDCVAFSWLCDGLEICLLR